MATNVRPMRNMRHAAGGSLPAPPQLLSFFFSFFSFLPFFADLSFFSFCRNRERRDA